MTCSRCGRDVMNGAPACPACASREAAAVTSPARAVDAAVLAGAGRARRHGGVTGGEGAPATPAPPVPVATPAPPPVPGPPPAVPDPLPAAPAVSKYDLRAPAPGTGGRRIMLISAALVLVLAGAGGVAALV